MFNKFTMLLLTATALTLGLTNETWARDEDMTCSEKYYPRNGECQRCPSNALMCHWDGSKVVIDACDSSNFHYYLKDNTCIQCSSVNDCHWDGTRVVQDRCSGVCSTGGCQYYYVKDGNCVACPYHAHCRLENNNLVTYACDGYTMLVNGTCVAKSGNCKYGQYYKDGTCTNCPSGMSTCHWDGSKVIPDTCEPVSYGSSVVVDGKCKTCKGAPACYLKDGKVVSDECYQGYVLVNGVCQSCDGAAKCHLEGDEIVPETCYSGYAMVNGSCQKCVGSGSCFTVGDKVISNSCNTGYVYVNGTCKPCGNVTGVYYCHWDGNKAIIDRCYSNYYLKDNKCVPCSTVNATSCLWDGDGVRTFECGQDKYYKDGGCYSCGSNVSFCHWDGEKVVVDRCYADSYIKDNECIRCPSIDGGSGGCHWDGEKVVADGCKSGQFMQNGDKCSLCKNSGRASCNFEDGSMVEVIDALTVLAVNFDGDVLAKRSCSSPNNLDCVTEVYDEDGNVIAEYDDDNNPVAAYDYSDDGSTLVYDDQCYVKERLDPNGNSMYNFGDSLNGTRRTHYTPPEAAEIVGDSQDNMIVMYFK